MPPKNRHRSKKKKIMAPSPAIAAGDKHATNPNPRRRRAARAEEDNSNDDDVVAVATAQQDNDDDDAHIMTKKNVEESDLVIQKLNELGLGEDISYQEVDGYFDQLLEEHPPVDTSTQLNFDQLDVLDAYHALYRIKYYEAVSVSELNHDELTEQYPFNILINGEVITGFEKYGTFGLLDKEKVFMCFSDDTFDWFFHPDYCTLASLDDYQRLGGRSGEEQAAQGKAAPHRREAGGGSQAYPPMCRPLLSASHPYSRWLRVRTAARVEPSQCQRPVLTGPAQKKVVSMPRNKQAKEKKTRVLRSRPVPPTRKPSFSSANSHSTPICLDECHSNTVAQDDDMVQDNNLTVINQINDAAARKNVEEANLVIQELNQLGLGEDISYEEFDGYFNRLLEEHPPVDISTQLDFDQLDVLDAHHAFYRIKYYEWSQAPGSMLNRDELIEQYPFNILEKGEVLSGTFDLHEKDEILMWSDGAFDWFFHPDYCKLAALDDYQRLGYRYVNWDMYHKFLHTYKVEKDYLKYCKELSEKFKWGRISTRGAYQAFKIATEFPNITPELAYLGFHELEYSMNYDVCHFKELDGVHFEIWLRVNKQKMSFRDALMEVYELNRFPIRQNRMKYALENDCSKLEEEFYTCTACVTEDVAEDDVQGLIAQAIKRMMDKPLFYEDYIRKKMNIARVIGLITAVCRYTAYGGYEGIRLLMWQRPT
uniref:Uncharacterized protein n=1 Tax=Oryza punctata TaxID=4537 RepID=A0A0E0JU62_ORYPU